MYVHAWLTLLSDSPCSSGGKPAKVYREFLRNILSQDLITTITQHASLADELVKSMTLYGAGSLTGTYIEAMKSTPIFFEYIRFLKTGDSSILRYILTFLWFGKKLDYVDDALQAVAFHKWLAKESDLSGFDVSSVIDLTDDMSVILDVLIGTGPNLPINFVDDGPVTISSQLPNMAKHGPGTVSDTERSPQVKTSKMSYDARLDKCFRHSYRRRSEYTLGMLPNAEAWKRKVVYSRWSNVAKLMFVPKNIRTYRSISKEPAAFQYHQQEVLANITDAMATGPLGQFVTLSDQTRNQILAHWGSVYGNLDTLDLRSASDSVHVDLVRKVFPRRWLFYLLGTRTSKVRLPNDKIMSVQKFAPMGSAVCFPVQTLIFSAVCIREYFRDMFKTERPITKNDVLNVLSRLRKCDHDNQHKHTEFSVYGDDIICDSKITQCVTMSLERLGFEVNTEKSFTASQAFRESCGKFYWNGNDVTPFLFRPKTFKKDLTFDNVTSTVEAANNLVPFGYKSLRRMLINHVLNHPIEGIPQIRGKNPIRFTRGANAGFGIHTETPETESINTHLVYRHKRGDLRGVRWNLKLQRHEWRSVMPKVEIQKYYSPGGAPFDFEHYRLNQWHRATWGRKSLDEIVEILPHRVSKTALRWGWTSIED
jgi:hypothetical protein